jgi:thiol-disulfide isomerase/thioredoxin
LPAGETAAPSCILNGLQLTNFALPDVNYGENGRIWEYRKDRAARLVLLDFWHTGCKPCRDAIPWLVNLQAYYDKNYPKTLQIVGIAYEEGTPEKQAQQVRSFRGRYNIKYPTLLGNRVKCPVFEQFGVEAYPTFVLLDETGRIVWRRQGFDQAVLAELDAAIRKQLGR